MAGTRPGSAAVKPSRALRARGDAEEARGRVVARVRQLETGLERVKREQEREEEKDKGGEERGATAAIMSCG
jgi:hypothetical protein